MTHNLAKWNTDSLPLNSRKHASLDWNEKGNMSLCPWLMQGSQLSPAEALKMPWRPGAKMADPKEQAARSHYFMKTSDWRTHWRVDRGSLRDPETAYGTEGERTQLCRAQWPGCLVKGHRDRKRAKEGNLESPCRDRQKRKPMPDLEIA